MIISLNFSLKTALVKTIYSFKNKHLQYFFINDDKVKEALFKSTP